ncbi:replication protein [Cronobacter malonaticus]|nr:replication protein [Cronobacter malonaticus]
MENQKHGYIPLYRSVKKQPWAKDVFLRTLWENLLIDAARQPYTANYKGQRWPLEIGQLVTTSADLGLSLCDRNGEPTSRHAVERMLAFFEREGMISVKAERRKGTLITVLNYAEYAEKTPTDPAHMSAHNPAHNKSSCDKGSRHDPAHMSAHNPAHHEQEYKNKNTNKPPKSPKGDSSRFDPLSIPVPEWLNQEAWFEWVKYRQDSKKPIKTEITVTKAFGVLKDCFDCGYDPAEIINSSIANGYQGLFKPKFPVRKQLPLAQHQPEQHWNSRDSWENEFL